MGEGDLAKGEEKLAAIARDLVKAVRRNLSVDRTARDDVQAALRSTIKRLLARHGCPPDVASGGYVERAATEGPSMETK